MKIGKLRIISEDEYQRLRKSYQQMGSVSLVYRWFSGWKDLDIIWDYVFNKSGKMIENARADYASARGTNEYGQSKGEG